MLYSMTGFGKASAELDTKNILVTIQAVNSKSLDIKIKLPSAYREQEAILRRDMAQATERGKIDINVSVQDISGETQMINHALFAIYVRELKLLCQQNEISESEILRSALLLPKMQEVEEDANSGAANFALVEATIQTALERLDEFRRAEGVALMDDFMMRNALILKYLDDLSIYEGDRLLKIRAKLEQAIAHWTAGTIKHFDENRIEQELFFYIEKLDITEEKIRLQQHCAFFVQELQATGYRAKGKKLSFIAQEIGREINTIGSKANHAEMQYIVVCMKDELEKIKEQINNIL